MARFSEYGRQGSTERRAAGELERIIEHYRGLEVVNPDLVLIVDRELIIRYVNKTAARLLNKRPAEMIGKYVELFLSSDALGSRLKRLRQVFRTGTPATATDLITLAGEELFMHTRVVAVKELSGAISGVLFVSRDVSELRPPSLTRPCDEAGLSDREEEVLGLIAEGKTNKEIGQTLFISPKTVDVHRTRIMKKLGAHNTAELIMRSRQSGLLL